MPKKNYANALSFPVLSIWFDLGWTNSGKMPMLEIDQIFEGLLV